MMRRGLVWVSSLALAVAFALLGAAPRAFAQANTGRVDGTVVDANGAPLGRVTITATSPTQIGGKRQAQSNEGGEFHLLGLTPGYFRLQFEAPGLRDVIKDEVHVGVNQAVSVDILMEAATAEETQVITAERKVIEVRKSSIGENYDERFLKNMPLQARQYQSIMTLAAGVVDSARNGNPNVRGGAGYNNSYVVDGMDTSDPVTHTFGTNFNFDAISEVQMQTAGQGAENSLTTGGVVNLETKSGSNKFQVDSSVYYVDQHLVWKGQGEDDLIFSNFQPNLNFGGPIVKDKLWYYLSAQYSRTVRSLPPDPNGVLPSHPSRVFNGLDARFKLTWAPTSRQRVTFVANESPANLDNTRQDITILPEAERRQEQFTQIYSLIWDSPITDSLFVKLGAGFQQVNLNIFPQQCMWDLNCKSHVGYSDVATGIRSGNDGGFITRDTRDTYRAFGSVSYFPSIRQEIKTGFQLNYSLNPVTTEQPGGIFYVTRNGNALQRSLECTDEFDSTVSPATAYDPNNPAGSRCHVGPLTVQATGITGNYYLQDTFSPTRYLHVTPGAALEYGQMVNYADVTITKFVTATPHLNVTWDATHDGKTAFRAGFNQYVDVGSVQVADFVGRQQYDLTCQVDPAMPAMMPLSAVYGTNCSASGGVHGNTVGHPIGVDGMLNPLGPQVDLDPPRTTEVFVGADRELLEQFAMGMEFIYRRYSNMWEDIETNRIWAPDGTNYVTKNGTDRSISDLETPDLAFRRYYGFTLTARKYVGRMTLLGSWTISQTYGPAGNFASLFLDNPTQTQYYFTETPDDRRHALKMQMGYDVTQAWNIGGVFNYVTGGQYSKFYLNPTDNAYEYYRSPRGTVSLDGDPSDSQSWQETRYPDQIQLDFHLAYSLLPLTGHNLMFMGDVFNILNMRTPVTIETRNLPAGGAKQFGDVTDRLPPLQVRVALRYIY